MTNTAIAWSIFFLLVIAGVAFIYYESGPSAPSYMATSTAPTAFANSMTLAGGVVGISYPDSYGLATTPAQLLVQSYIPPCDQGFDYCLYRIDPSYASTTFESAGVRITLRKDLTSQDTCLSTAPAGYTALTPTTTQGSNYSASAFGPLSDAATGHYSSGALYRLYASGQCTEFETRIGESQYANYPPGTIGEFTAADKAAVAAELGAILNTVTVAGTPVAFPIPPTTSTGP